MQAAAKEKHLASQEQNATLAFETVDVLPFGRRPELFIENRYLPILYKNFPSISSVPGLLLSSLYLFHQEAVRLSRAPFNVWP
jgi:hypothetical protein